MLTRSTQKFHVTYSKRAKVNTSN